MTVEPEGIAEHGRSSPIAWYALAVLILSVVVGFLDRQILVLVVEPMKRDIGLDDLHIGALQGLAPALFAVLAGFPLAWLADRMDRRWLLIACILFWSAATAARGFADNFNELLVLTTGIAVGEAALTPIIYSLIPDLFSGRKREIANFVFFGAIVTGMGIGLMLGGAVLGSIDDLRPLLPEAVRTMETWRLACIAVAAPGALVALLVIPVPARRTACDIDPECPGERGATLLPYLRANMPAVALVFGGIGIYGAALSLALSWLPIAIMRGLGVPAAEVGVRFGAIFSIAAILGLCLAAATASFWRRRAPDAHAVRAMSFAMGSATIPMIALAFVTDADQAYALGGAILVLFFAGSAHSPTLLQDLAPPQLRARISAISMIIYTLGAASAPMLVGAVSKATGEQPAMLLPIVAVLGASALVASAIVLRLAERPFIETRGRVAGAPVEPALPATA
ncbi:MAG: MFS transporter [Sphingomonadales bacterium]|nr:MAG: MFS transporter [Sphingomonadales bacterium]